LSTKPFKKTIRKRYLHGSLSGLSRNRIFDVRVKQLKRGRGIIKKTAVALGGFIILVGIVLLATFSLVMFGIFDPNIFLSGEAQMIFVCVLLILGIVDLVAGLILLIA
jgi:hypothetical protein